MSWSLFWFALYILGIFANRHTIKRAEKLDDVRTIITDYLDVKYLNPAVIHNDTELAFKLLKAIDKK